ncbi:hypothetical protein JKP88DRAFT_290458 [Tribonema minus]|uniref:Uncharacterized protein n=1 Tax=Tribonema minus TaxID=303371 RepID=A0A836CFI1_9STRA|nr:hypothetical protein JKP88DRAFT_290458 [Tribonema minus]
MALASLKRGTSQIAFVFQGTVQVWAHEVVIVLGAASAAAYLIDIVNNPTIWASSTPKRIVVPAGVERGSGTSWVFAPMPAGSSIASSWGGSLTLEIRGTLSGIGGTANSGVGGSVIVGTVTGKDGQKLIVNVFAGAILRAGGGGGVWVGGIYYYAVSQTGQNGGDDNTWYWYSIARQYTVTDVPNYTAGGVAANAGKGQGFDGPATVGGAAVGGGTNAGASGKSGDGGGYGSPGTTGANGTNGNASAGLAGAAPGLAGFYLTGAANVALERIVSHMNGVGASIVNAYPMAEVQSWTIQKGEAEALHLLGEPAVLAMTAAEVSAAAPFLVAVCLAHYGPPTDDATGASQLWGKVVEVKTNADLWAGLSAFVNGLRARAKDQIANAVDEAEVFEIESGTQTELSAFRDLYGV